MHREKCQRFNPGRRNLFDSVAHLCLRQQFPMGALDLLVSDHCCGKGDSVLAEALSKKKCSQTGAVAEWSKALLRGEVLKGKTKR